MRSVKTKNRGIGIKQREDEESIVATLAELRGIMLESSSAEIGKRRVKIGHNMKSNNHTMEHGSNHERKLTKEYVKALKEYNRAKLQASNDFRLNLQIRRS